MKAPVTDSRVVFASIPNRQMTKILLDSGCDKVLYSYWFLRNLKDDEVAFLLKATAKKATIFIDSGVFSLYRKMKVPGISRKMFEVPKEIMDGIREKGQKKFKDFLAYTKEYVKFLNKYDRYITWAFEMDIDIFASVRMADQLYIYIKKNYKNPDKILRVWHFTRTFADWSRWSKKYKYLALEGAGTHGRDISFYKRFINHAHDNGTKVHVLALTSPNFLKHVNCDTADSSSWSMGGRFGRIETPFGVVNVGHSPGKTGNSRRWDTLSKSLKDVVVAWLKEHGLETNPEILRSRSTEGWMARNLICIKYFQLYGNLPVDNISHATTRSTFLDTE